MGTFFDFLSSTAVSLTVSGNTGLSPFLSLFLIGLIEKLDPTALNMDGITERILSNWFSITVLALISIVELVGKCVPVVGSFIDSAEMFIVPILSTFSSISTLGLLDLANTGVSTVTSNNSTNVTSIIDVVNGTATTIGNVTTVEGATRMLASSSNGAAVLGDSVLMFLKVIIVLTGVTLAILLYLFKLLIRVIGIGTCAGCCDPFITVLEIATVGIGITVAIFIRQIAIVTCILIFIAAGYTIIKRQKQKLEQENNTTNSNQPNNYNQLQQNTSDGTAAVAGNIMVDTESNKPTTPTTQASSSPSTTVTEGLTSPVSTGTNDDDNVDTPISVTVIPSSIADHNNDDVELSLLAPAQPIFTFNDSTPASPTVPPVPPTNPNYIGN